MKHKLKIGDRVLYRAGNSHDTGTITEPYESEFNLSDNKECHCWWVIWDSNKSTEYVDDKYLTKISSEVVHNTNSLHDMNADVMQLLKKAAIIAIENSNYYVAVKIIKVIQGK